jgi:hypothetical protein
MTDDDLRAALAAADPARSADLDPLTSPRARELLERAMTSDLSTPIAPAPAEPTRPSRTPWLATQSVALAGTVSSVDAAEVRLDVTRWYRGGDAGTVVLRNADERLQALLGTPDFSVGEDYLVSSSDGSISVCGLTGAASPELQAAYDEAFTG